MEITEAELEKEALEAVPIDIPEPAFGYYLFAGVLVLGGGFIVGFGVCKVIALIFN